MLFSSACGYGIKAAVAVQQRKVGTSRIKGMIMRFLCLLGMHRRSRGRARPRGDIYVSVCRRCNAPMERGSNGRWNVCPAAGDEPA